MAKKIDNKVLLVLLIVLIALFFIVRMVKTGKTERSFKTELVQIDTANIFSILLYPKAGNLEEIKFTRENGNWMVSKDDVFSVAEENSVEGLLAQLEQAKPKRLAANNKSKWEEFHVNDSLATRIIIIEKGEKITLDLMVGRFTYQESQNPYGGRGNITGTTFVRLRNEDEVYAVDGFLTMSVNREFSSWRNQKIANTRKEDITKLIFNYPSDSGYIAMKMDSVWMINGVSADSLKVDQYLTSLGYVTHSEFADDFKPQSSPDFELTIEGNNFSPVSIQAFMLPGEEFIINSSINPRSFFRSDIDNVFGDLFKSLTYFITPE